MAKHDQLTNATATTSNQPMNTSATASEHVPSPPPAARPTSRPSTPPHSPISPEPPTPPAGPADPPPTAETWELPLYKSGKNKGKVRTYSKRLENTF